MDVLVNNGNYILSLAIGLVVLLLFWLVLWWRQRHSVLTQKKVFDKISHDALQDFVVPSTEDGEIHIDHLLLTAKGLLVVDVKDVNGAVFGGDKMQDWTVIHVDGRFTFRNPQAALRDRVAAIKLIVRDIPVSGRILFLADARFTKGIPSMACGLQELLDEFGEQDAASAQTKVNAFRPLWDRLKDEAMSTQLGRILRR